MSSAADPILPARYAPRFDRFFGRYIAWLLRRNFHAVRLAAGTREAIDPLNAEPDRPAIVVFNHASWWDPLLAKFLALRFTPGRPTLAPMDRAQLERFGFFRKIGVFGIDPADPAVLDPMVDYVLTEFARDPRQAFWVTAQGTFADVREPVRLRPGPAALAARLDNPDVRCIAIEYTHWQDKRPEIFVRFADCPAQHRSTTGWLRAMTAAMQANAEALAQLVVARDQTAFEPLLGADAARINPIYDAWLTLRGKTGAVPRGRDNHASTRSTTPAGTSEASA